MTNNRICVICGAEFTPNSPSQKICGKKECYIERRRRYTRNHAEMYRQLNREYRKIPRVKEYRAAYDKEYQLKHKEQIKEYKKMWFQKQQFLKYLEKGKLLKNIYYYSLSQEERQQALDKIK